jgi:antitoxin component YwqK of YwqJK toxin-antitoxin module
MADQWQVSRGGKQHGPFTTPKLKQLASEGRIQPSDMLRKDGMQKWVQASAVKGLFPAQVESDEDEADSPPVIPPIPRSERTNKGGVPVALVASLVGGGVLLLLGVILAVVLLLPGKKTSDSDKVASNNDKTGTQKITGTKGGTSQDEGGKEKQPKGNQGDEKPQGKQEKPTKKEDNKDSDIPLPTFDKEAVKAPTVDFTKLDYTKGPNGEKLAPVEGVDADEKLVGPNGPVPIGKWLAHAFRDRSGIKKHGVETHWDLKGVKRQEMYWYDGKQHGLTKKWYEDGKIAAEGVFKEGKPHGLSVLWHTNGKKASEFVAIDGVQQGYYAIWYEDGTPRQEAMLKDGKPHGPAVEYHPNGKRKKQADHKDGKYHGKYYEWYSHGQLSRMATYEDGKLLPGTKKWTKSGELVVPLDLGALTKAELKQTIIDKKEGGVYMAKSNVGEVFEPIWDQELFLDIVGKPASDTALSKERLWTYRCKDGSITFKVRVGAGKVFFKGIQRQ